LELGLSFKSLSMTSDYEFLKASFVIRKDEKKTLQATIDHEMSYAQCCFLLFPIVYFST